MITIDATLRHALEVSGPDLILTLDPALQGLPETAHGGSVLAVFDQEWPWLPICVASFGLLFDFRASARASATDQVSGFCT